MDADPAPGGRNRDLLLDLRRLRFSRRRPVMALAVMLLGAALTAPADAREGTRPASRAETVALPDDAAQRRDSQTTAQARALQRASDAVVGIETHAVDGAASSESLGRLRRGSGVVIDGDGLVLTIGYLVLEAEDATIVLDSGKRVPARVLGQDIATGFGLLQAVVPLGVPPAAMAKDVSVTTDDALLLVSGGDEGAISLARMAARGPFSGYWEYHIEGALFTHPARDDHSGAGLFNAQGELLGIGSLLMRELPGNTPTPGNMFVPIDLLAPVMAELRTRGTGAASRRAWLGLQCDERQGSVQVLRVNRGSPADQAGLEPGDVITAIDGVPVATLEVLYKTLWQGGPPEREVGLAVLRQGEARTLRARSVDRQSTLRRPVGI
jgi:serine protease Do